MCAIEYWDVGVNRLASGEARVLDLSASFRLCSDGNCAVRSALFVLWRQADRPIDWSIFFPPREGLPA
jgi:hypothetical protein